MLRTYKVWLFGAFATCKLVEVRAKDVTDCRRQVAEKHLNNRYYNYRINGLD